MLVADQGLSALSDVLIKSGRGINEGIRGRDAHADAIIFGNLSFSWPLDTYIYRAQRSLHSANLH